MAEFTADHRVMVEGYVEQYLAPLLRGSDVVVMDNLWAHKSPRVTDAIELAGATVWFLPQHSPDLNPIEQRWSKGKSWLRRATARTFDAIGRALIEALRTVTTNECANYLRSCGYKKR